VQSISLLAYLAETHDIWGPFLVVAPASTLHNWQQELTRFVPNLKALPYWGNVKDRATLRKFWSKKEISYNQEAPFHVLITSYQLVREDVIHSFKIYILFSIGDARSTILSTCQMAIHDIGRSSKHQEFLERKMENSFGFPMPEQTLIDWHPHSKLDAR
jgi:chromatin-remodeling ATPase INO80